MEDKDLVFLNQCSNEQLQLLADFMLYDTDGKARWSEELSSTKGFRENYPDKMKLLVPNIIDELQRFGGNTFFNWLRGHGAPYREILEHVCTQSKVSYNKNAPIELIEHYLLQKFLLMSIDRMNESDVKHLSENLTKDAFKQQIGLLKAGSPLFIKLTTMLIVNLATKFGLKQAVALITKFAGGRVFAILAGPIGWAVSGVWTAFDIAGPANRVLVPCVVTVAYLRSIYDKSEEDLNDILG